MPGLTGHLSLGPHGVRQEVLIGQADAVFEFGFIGPAESGGFGDVEEFAGRAVGTGGVPFDAARVAHDFGHQFGELFDGEFLAGAGIDGLVAGVVVHQEHAEVGEVVDVEEFAEGRAVAPAGDARRPGEFRLVEAADERRQHVRVLRVVVIVGPVQIGRHHGNVVRPVLAVQEFTVFEAGDFRQGVGLVGLFEFAREQAVFLHRLRRHPRVDAAAAEEFELLAAVLPRRVDDVHLEDHIVVHKVGQRILVRHDAADFGRRQEYIFRLLLLEEGLDIRLPAEVELLMRPGNDVRVSLPLQLPHNGGAHHTPVTGDVDFAVFLHQSSSVIPGLTGNLDARSGRA